MNIDDLLLRRLGADPEEDVAEPDSFRVAPGKTSLSGRLMTYRKASSRPIESHPDRAAAQPGSAARAPSPGGTDDPFGVHLPPPTGMIQRKETGGQPGDDAHARVAAAGGSSGAPLPAELRNKFEGALGADLGGVRVHQGSASADAAHSIAARAYTVGQDIHFAAGEYDPGSPAGEHLLAHEVAHTVQQAGGAAVQTKLEVSEPGDFAEREADTAADAMVRGESAAVSSISGGSIARAPQPGAGPVVPATGGAGLSADMFEPVSGDAPAAPGTVGTEAAGNTKIKLVSPEISFNWKVRLKAPLGETDRIDVGPIQTLLNANRVGVYREGGKPDGAIIAEQKTDLGEMRDVTGEIDKAAQVGQSTVAPFYSMPTALNKDNQEATIAFKDKPKAVFPLVVGSGKLTETKGEDSFVTSVSAKNEGGLIHLKTFKWQLPWTAKITDTGNVANDDQGNSTSGGISQQKAAAGEGVAHGEGAVPITAAPGATHMDFQTQEAADSAGVGELIRYLANATGPSQGFIAEALRKKNVSFHVVLTVNKTNSTVGADSIEMSLRGGATVTRERQRANDGAKIAIQVPLTEVFPDLTKIKSGTAVSILAQDKSLVDGKVHRTDWPWPFAGLDGKMEGSSGDYTIGCTFG